MGTPGTTRAMKPGDVVEVEIEGIGVLRTTSNVRSDVEARSGLHVRAIGRYRRRCR
jgi:hypothetical protein